MPIRSAWKGALSFGLVNVPIKLYKATEEHDAEFHFVHNTDLGRIRNKRQCEMCEEYVEMADVRRAVDIGAPELVMFESDDFEALKTQNPGIVQLAHLGSAPDPLKVEGTYYISPEKSGERALSVLVEAVRKEKKSIYGTLAIRHKDRACAIWLRGDQLVLGTLRFDDEIRQIEYIPQDVNRDEVAMARQLLQQMSGEPIQHDTYRVAVMDLAKQKAEGQIITRPTTKKADAPVDLMEALRASVQKAREDQAQPTKGKKSRKSA